MPRQRVELCVLGGAALAFLALAFLVVPRLAGSGQALPPPLQLGSGGCPYPGGAGAGPSVPLARPEAPRPAEPDLQSLDWLRQGLEHRRAGRLEQALAAFQKSRQADPGNVRAILSAAIVYDYDLQDRVRAARLYQDALDAGPAESGLQGLEARIRQLRQEPAESRGQAPGAAGAGPEPGAARPGR